MGMVYGGLATTPLYLYSSLPFQATTQDDYLGLLSIIFWTLTLIGGVKYMLIVLYADDNGEGGTFALYSLLSRHVNISLKRKAQGGDSCQKTRLSLISWIEESQVMKKSIFYLTMLATCMVMGDGILTPAISGLVVIISVALLIGLFLLQKVGTHHISFMFSPIIVTWLTTTPLIGLYNILKHYPTVYKAISPYYMLKFFSIHGKMGWLALGGTTLCITGAEAMFADLGHFNRPSMQLGFLLGVYPSNLITYAGLTAYLIKNPEHQGQAFYKFTPTSVFWPMLIVSTLAAIVASQGLILACFSLIKQCVAMDCFPRVKIIHTSRECEGQVYSPQVNFCLMVLCVATVIGFHNGNALGNAYGVAVIMVMLTTTMLLTLVMVGVWGVSAPLALSFFLFFTLVESCNLSAVLSKVPKGGWLPFSLAILLAILVFTWVEARAKISHFEISHSIPLSTFTHMLQKASISRVTGVCFIHTLPHNPNQIFHSTNLINSCPNEDNNTTNFFHNHNISHLNQQPVYNNDQINQHPHQSINHVTCHTISQYNQIKQNGCPMNHLVEVNYPPPVFENLVVNSLPTSINDLDSNPHSHEHNEATPSPKPPTNHIHHVHPFKDVMNNMLEYDDPTTNDHIKIMINHPNCHSNQCLEEPIFNVSNASGTNFCDSINHCNTHISSENGGEVDTQVPPLLQHYVQNTRSLHRVVVLTRFHIAKVPKVPKATRFFFTLLGEQLPLGTPPLGLYICNVHVGYAEPIEEHGKGLTCELLEHLEEFIKTQLARLAQLEEHVVELERTTQELEGHVADIEKVKQDMEALTFHMVMKPKLKLSPKSNFLCAFTLHKLYPLLQFHNPLSSFLSQIPRNNLLELTMTYEV